MSRDRYSGKDDVDGMIVENTSEGGYIIVVDRYDCGGRRVVFWLVNRNETALPLSVGWVG